MLSVFPNFQTREPSEQKPKFPKLKIDKVMTFKRDPSHTRIMEITSKCEES